MIKLPLNSQWNQPNTSDKFGSIAYSKNINLDQQGYIKLSPRSVKIMDDTIDTDFNLPVALGRYSSGTFRVTTVEDPFDVDVSETSGTIAEDGSSNNPNFSVDSHGIWFKNIWHTSTATAVYANNSGTWTADVITSLTSGVRHYMTVFKNRNTICVSNGNVVKQYDSSYAASTNLTIPADFEVIGMAYNKDKVGIITRLGDSSEGQNAESYFFLWNGADTSAELGISIGSYSAIAICAYKSSFAILTINGQLLYFNGGGFDVLANFPFYYSGNVIGTTTNFQAYGDTMVADGDRILINIGFSFNETTKKGEISLVNNQGGVWCYSPTVGLYHKYSPSNSFAYFHAIASANVNTTTDIFTTSATIPTTGGAVVLTNGSVGGLTKGTTYYVIRISSTTFKLADSHQNALDGQWIDITSADTNQYFWMYDIIDYCCDITRSGGMAFFGTQNKAFKDIIFGNEINGSSLTTPNTLCMTVPFLENRGYIVTPKIFLDDQETLIQKMIIKHKPLDTNDTIIVKVKTKDYLNIPSSSPNDNSSDEITWTSTTTGTTNSDLSEVKTAFDAGEDFELELYSGTGAGQMVKITDITESSGTYTITTEDEIIGSAVGLKSYFFIDNWKFYASVDTTTQKRGIFEVPLSITSRAPQFKIELRGYETTIEDILIDNKENLPA